MTKYKCRAKNPATCIHHGKPENKNNSSPLKSTTHRNLDKSQQALIARIKVSSRFDKQAIVRARKGRIGEIIHTILADGTVETTNTAKDGDIIVTNPGGEQYIMSKDKFRSRYAFTGEKGVFKATGTVQAIKNPLRQPISITAPWGEQQYGDENCWLAIPVDSNETPYIIGAKEFDSTYGGINKGY